MSVKSANYHSMSRKADVDLLLTRKNYIKEGNCISTKQKLEQNLKLKIQIANLMPDHEHVKICQNISKYTKIYLKMMKSSKKNKLSEQSQQHNSF